MPSRTVFAQEMKTLNDEVIQMAEMAKEAIKKGVQAFLNGDIELQTEVSAMDKEIYKLDLQIEKHCLDVIALHQPVAVDLRTVSTCLKIITDINRIGRYGRDIAELADHYVPDRQYKKVISIPLMSQLSIAMVDDAIDSFVTRDDKKARCLFVRDDEVDSLWDTIFRESLTYMIEDPRNITPGTHYILVARYLERIADHSCNIADRVVFMTTGSRVDPYEMKKACKQEAEAKGPEDPSDGHYIPHLSEK